MVNDKQVNFDAYNIRGYNYFKLRDIALALRGSVKQFEVGWDAVSNTITLTSGKPYTEVGGEMAKMGVDNQTANWTTSTICLNGVEVRPVVYKINNNNYFMLRDLRKALDFNVSWDSATNTITIDTSMGYQE